MRRAVGAQEEARAAARDRSEERHAVALPLEDRRAVVMGPQASREEGVAVHEQVLRGDGSGDSLARTQYELHGGPRGDVLEHYPQARMALGQRRQHRVDEARLALEHIDCGISDFTVHLQHQARLRHALEHRIEPPYVGDSGGGVGGSARRIELAAEHAAGGLGSRDFLHRSLVGEVDRHQRLELSARGDCGADALAIGEGGRGGGDRRDEIRHDNGARKTGRGEGQYCGERCPIPQMQVPVIRPAQHEHAHRAPSSSCRTFCFSSSSSARRTPKPVTSVATCARPPTRVAEERST